MQGLGVEDGAGDAEVRFVADGGGGAQVGGAADAFEDRGEGDEAAGVGEGERVLAGGDGGYAGGGEGAGEELDVGFFVVCDVFEVAVVEVAEAGGKEVAFGHGADAAFVEDVFEVLELGGGVSMGGSGGMRGMLRWGLRTVRANWRISASVMVAWRTVMGAASAATAKREAVISFMVVVEVVIEDRASSYFEECETVAGVRQA